MSARLARLAPLLLLALLAAAGAPAFAQEAPARNVEELMRKSGIWKQVAQVEPALLAGLAQGWNEAAGARGIEDSQAGLARLKAAARRAYGADILRAEMQRQLAESLDKADEEKALAWLETDLGRRLTKLEEDAGEGAEPNARMREAREYAAAAPASRVALAERFAQALRSGEAGASMMIGISMGVVSGVVIATTPQDTSAVAAVRRRFESQRPQLEAAMLKIAVDQFVFTYREVPEADLERYVEFAQSPSGRRYHDATREAMDKVLAQASVRFGVELGNMKPGLQRQAAGASLPSA